MRILGPIIIIIATAGMIAVPEPTTAALVALGLIVLMVRRKFFMGAITLLALSVNSAGCNNQNDFQGGGGPAEASKFDTATFNESEWN